MTILLICLYLSTDFHSSNFIFSDSGARTVSEYRLLQKGLQLDTLPPEIEIISPKSQIYPATVWYCGLDAFSLIFNVNEPVSWIGYSLDGKNNVTINENVTIDTVIGSHYVTIYANDTSGNMGASETITFTIKSFPPSSTVTTDDLNSTTFTSDFETPLQIIWILVSLSLLLYVRKEDLDQ
jgi:hypothetical protein